MDAVDEGSSAHQVLNDAFNSTCSHQITGEDQNCIHPGGTALHVAKICISSLSLVLNLVVLGALLRNKSASRTKGFAALIGIEVFFSANLIAVEIFPVSYPTACAAMSYTVMVCKVVFTLRSWWIVSMSTARFIIVLRPFRVRSVFTATAQKITFCGLLIMSALTVFVLDRWFIPQCVMTVHMVLFLQTILMSTAPLLVVLVLTCGMSVSLIRRSMQWHSDSMDCGKRATYTLLLVSAAFFILCVPHSLYETLMTIFSIHDERMLDNNWLNVLGEVKTFLISLDSAMNFAIYFVMSVSFRKQMTGVFRPHIKPASPCTSGRNDQQLSVASNTSHGRKSTVYRAVYITEC